MGQRQAGALSDNLIDEVAKILEPYLRAWGNGTDSGDCEFEEMAGSEEASIYLAAKVSTVIKS